MFGYWVDEGEASRLSHHPRFRFDHPLFCANHRDEQVTRKQRAVLSLIVYDLLICLLLLSESSTVDFPHDRQRPIEKCLGCLALVNR